MNNGVLYISYDGMLEPLGQSQVLSYLKILAVEHRIFLISYEKATDWKNLSKRESIAEEIESAGISWHPLRYHKSPSALATAWDILCGTSLGLWLILLHRLKIVHARSYVPSVMALALKQLLGVKFLFDMRGFWADERIDGDLWRRNSAVYCLAKKFEKHFLMTADHVVSLTQAAVREMECFDYLQGKMPTVTVIPTCTNLTRFKPMVQKQLESRFLLGYVGSASNWYLFDKVVDCFTILRNMRPNAHFLIINRGQHEFIRNELVSAGVPDSAYEIVAADHSSVPGIMMKMDAGIFFYRPSYSRAACSPTKLGEFLGCGIPCLSNTGIGDMAEVLEKERVGVAITSFDEVALKDGLNQLIELVVDLGTRARCVAAAEYHFSLTTGTDKYNIIYSSLLNRH